jgi:GNAT superfamily N-acetyltransferase
MIKYRRLEHSDYDDIVDISKNIWDGNDYLPEVFHDWVDAEGYFFGAVDDEKDKVIGVAKYSVLYDKSGWLEGLRVHKDYRGRKIARSLSEIALNYALEEQRKGSINKIAFGTHITNIESRTLMEKLNFELEQKYIIISKSYENFDTSIDVSKYDIKYYSPDYNEFKNLDYFKHRNNILPLAFVFQEPTKKLYEEFIEHKAFISINGHKGVFKHKGEPYFEVFDESFEGINDFMNYYLDFFKDENESEPTTCILPNNEQLIEKLKANNFNSWAEWVPDYLLYIYEL